MSLDSEQLGTQMVASSQMNAGSIRRMAIANHLFGDEPWFIININGELASKGVCPCACRVQVRGNPIERRNKRIGEEQKGCALCLIHASEILARMKSPCCSSEKAGATQASCRSSTLTAVFSES